jgi:hypothetical protein
MKQVKEEGVGRAKTPAIADLPTIRAVVHMYPDFTGFGYGVPIELAWQCAGRHKTRG